MNHINHGTVLTSETNMTINKNVMSVLMNKYKKTLERIIF